MFSFQIPTINKKVLSTPPLTLGLMLTIFLSLSQPVHAQKTPFSLSLSPPITHIIVQPGKTAVQTFTLQNSGSADLEIKPELRDFTSDQRSGEPVLLDKFTFPYLKLAGQAVTEPFSLPAGTAKQFTLQFDIPDSALEREYHFTLLFSGELAQPITEGNQGTLTTQLGSNLIVTITRTEKDLGQMRVKEFRQWRVIDSFMAIEPEIYVENIGKNMSVTTGQFTVNNALTRQSWQQDILPQNVLPNASRQLWAAQFEEKDQEEFAQGVAFRYDPLFLFGQYTVSLNYHSPNQNPQTYQVHVFAFPFSLVIIFLMSFVGYKIYSRLTSR